MNLSQIQFRLYYCNFLFISIYYSQMFKKCYPRVGDLFFINILFV